MKLSVQRFGSQTWEQVVVKNDLIIPGSVIWPLARQVRREAEQEWNFMRTSKTWAGLIQSAFDGPNLLDLVSFAFATGKHG